jgi:hypothetical protein
MACIRGENPLELCDGSQISLASFRRGEPPYMLAWNRGTSLGGETDRESLVEALEDHLASGGLRRRSPDLFGLVALLSAWDDVIREIGLYSGRIYLASEEATRRLFEIAGAEAPPKECFRALLLEAQSLELIYRFPVAFKFRRTYGSENQCRLNGWGRRLARRATRDRLSATIREDWHAGLRSHLLKHADVYGRHIEYVGSEGLASAPGDSFSLATRLPIPILL